MEEGRLGRIIWRHFIYMALELGHSHSEGLEQWDHIYFHMAFATEASR
jgi:hypothetical protein